MFCSKKMPPKKVHCKCPLPGPIDPCNNNNPACPSHPDLLLLRDAAADERTAAAFYLRAAHQTCLDGLFLNVAEDEMHHYMELMQLIAVLDPIQARIFSEMNLPFLLIPRHKQNHAKWQEASAESTPEDDTVSPPSLEEMETVDVLTQAIVDELLAINKYQTYMQEANLPEVKELFCHIMNEEKEHLAEFTKALFCITHEPLLFD